MFLQKQIMHNPKSSDGGRVVNWPIIMPQHQVDVENITSLFVYMDLHIRRDGPEHEVLGKALLHAVRMHYFDSYMHYAPEIGEWCGYKPAEQAEGEAEWNRTPTTSLTSNDKSQLPF